MALTLAQKAKLRAGLMARGIYWTDEQIEAHAESLAPEEVPSPSEAKVEFPKEAVGPEASIWEHTTDAVGSGLWSLLDVGLFGAPGAIWRATDRESYEDVMMDFQDTASGRVAGTLGGLAGFMIPMGWVGRGTSLAVRGIRGLRQGKALAAGKKVTNATTRTLQRKAADNLAKTVEKSVGKSGGKSLSAEDAYNIALKVSEETIGFSQKAWYKKIFRGGPAYKMEHSTAYVNEMRQIMKGQMPERLATELSKRGVDLTQKQLLKLSDDMVNQLATKPFNSIESLISGRFTGRVTEPLFRVAGGVAQEAVNFGIVGTLMDATQLATGDLDLDEQSFGSRVMHHALIGGAFGAVKFIPGGRNQGFWKDVSQAMGFTTRKLNKSIAKMGFDETKAFARLTMKNDRSFAISIDGSPVTKRMLRKGMGITEAQLPKLKSALIKHNNMLLKQFNGPGYRKIMKDMGIDFVSSFGRMAAGSTVMNWGALESGEFQNIAPLETAFHLGLGAFITKRGRPLFAGGEPGKGLGHFGEKEYYYDSDLADINKSLRAMGIRSDHIGDIVKQFDGNLYTDWVNRSSIQDVENVIDVLGKNNIVYDKSMEGERAADPRTEITLLDRELQNIIEPVVPIMRSRNIDFNPNTSSSDMLSALDALKKLKSVELSTENNNMFMDSRTNVQKSIFQGAEKSISDLQSDLYDSFVIQLQVLTGTDKPIDLQGKMNEINYDSDALTNPHDKMVLRKFRDLMENFVGEDVVRVTEYSTGKQKGIPVELSSDKIKIMRDIQDQFEVSLGQAVFGESWKKPVDMNDGGLWNLIREVNFQKNVTNVYDLILGREIPGVEPVDSDNIKSLVKEVLSHEKNMDHNIIVDKQTKLGFDQTGFTGSKDELLSLQYFVEHLWSIASTNKRPIDGRPVKVPIGVVQDLRDKLVKAGMPDPETHMLDGRMQDWFNKAISHGIDEATSGLDLDPYQATVVKRLMANGIIQLATTQAGKGTRLTAASKITENQVGLMKPGATNKEKKEYVEAYDRVMAKLGGKVIAFTEDFGLDALTETQLSAVKTADHIFNIHKFTNDFESYDMELANKIIGYKEEYRVLSERFDESSESERDQILAAMQMNKNIMKEYDLFREAFKGAYTGGVEMSRASAYLEFVKNTTDADGRTLLQRLEELDGAVIREDFVKITDRIRDLQIVIAEQVASRPDVRTQWDELRREQILRRKHQEIEGFMPEDRSQITPDKFFDKYEIKIEDVFSKGEPSYNQTYDSVSDALWTLYKDTVFKGNQDQFVDRMFKFTGETRETASDKLRDEVVHIADLFDRRYTIKRVGINMDSGKGVFENTDISKGFLTDIYSEVFGSDVMLLLDSDFMRNGRLNSLATNEGALGEIASVLSGTDFFATLESGSTKYEKFFRPGRVENITERGDILYEGVPIAEQYINGKHYVLRIDENITLLFPEKQFNKLATSFRRWYERVIDDPYTINSRKKLEAANDLFGVLKGYYDSLGESLTDKGYSPSIFGGKSQRIKSHEYMEDAVFTMFNVMYGERIDGDWLQDAYTNAAGSRKNYKYKRLAQNQGYVRNSNESRELVKEVWTDTSNEYVKDLIDKYTYLEKYNVFVVDDGDKSVTGKVSNKLITDNRSVAEQKLNEMKERNDISQEAYDEMLDILTKSNSINAEAVNSMTAVRREHLDYLLLKNGDQSLIGSSSGQKPVGLTSFETDGKIHVFYNKTHYFYDSKLDPFFKTNSHIEQIAFTSGAKKAKIVDKESLENLFRPFSNIPNVGSGETLHSWINGLEIKEGHESLMPVRFDQNLSGTVYGAAHDVKILKQFANWSSEKVQSDVYEWARADMAEKYADVNIHFYNPENTEMASREAKSFIRGQGNKDGTISTESDNASFASIWIEANGVPFSAVSKNLYDALIKRRHITDAGVFDGYTDAGGSPILRGNMAMDLDIPVFHEGKQIKIGETNVGQDYLDRKIHFIGDFGPAVTVKSGVKERLKYKTAGTVTLVYEHHPKGESGRDVVLDLKTGDIVDPLKADAKISDPEFKGLNNMMSEVLRHMNLEKGAVRTYQELKKELEKDRYVTEGKRKIYLGVIAAPGPRTGPHDILILKVKGDINKADGGLIEINPYDVTMRFQRDMDTDKMYFYMDTPFSVVRESYTKGADILEALPVPKIKIGLNPYDNQSFKEYNQKIIMYRRLFGSVVKTQRKLTYAQNLFEGLPDGIKLADGSVIRFKATKPLDAIQRLVTDTQVTVDSYDGFPPHLDLKEINDWTVRTLFGNSHESRIEGKINDEPFFFIEVNGEKSSISNRAHQAIVTKLLDDFGRLLNIESSVWDSGEAKSPRYSDMVSMYKDFKDEYRSDRVNYNFYNYLVKRGLRDDANKMFFGKPVPVKELISGKEIEPVMTDIAARISRLPSTFLKSLDTIAGKDYNRVRETFSPDGDYFNSGVGQWVGKYRAEVLELFRLTGQDLKPEQLSRKSTFVDQLWAAFRGERSNEEMIIQANTIEEQIRRTEWLISEESKKADPDQAFIDLQSENVELKRNALLAVMNRMSLDRSVGDQKFIDYRKGKDNIITVRNQSIAIRHKKTGELIKMLRPGDDPYDLKKNQVAVINPVVLKAITEHDLIDGVAFAQSVLGYYSNIQEGDIDAFRRIVNQTKGEVKFAIREFMGRSGYRDWATHETQALSIVQKGLDKIRRLGMEGATAADKIDDTWMGQMPGGKESYGLDFLMAMLVPDHTGNPNEYYFSPKTGGFMQAVRAPSKSVINAVMHTLNAYNIFPGGVDRKTFIEKFAQTHRGFYDAIVAGRGFEEGMARLNFNDFQGALLSQVVGKVAHNPFMPRAEFKKLSDTIEMGKGVESEFAELFRQMLQEGALTDPATAIRLRQEIIEQYGEDAYEALFQVARGRQIFDGISGRQYGTRGGEGQLLGHIMMDRSQIKNRRLKGKIPMNKGTEIKDFLNSEIGHDNEVRGKCE